MQTHIPDVTYYYIILIAVLLYVGSGLRQQYSHGIPLVKYLTLLQLFHT